MRRRSASLVRLLIVLIFPLVFPLSSILPAAPSGPENFPAIDLNDPAALQEATRILAEEVQLAARPQTYVIVDLVGLAVVIKARGAELHRFPIERWSGIRLAEASTVFRLKARPPVTRRKIDPADTSELPPISLDDMPTDFTLTFIPSFSLSIHPSASDDFWRWLRFTAREWWSWVKVWSRRLATGVESPTRPVLRLTLTPPHAQSLAWTVTEGMPFLIRRTSPPPP
ncbi:MAG TPA: hypothetical protein VJR03_14260 [Nitrospira sp.]|nr:hypothetical protein [Nitrospira sp.]